MWSRHAVVASSSYRSSLVNRQPPSSRSFVADSVNSVVARVGRSNDDLRAVSIERGAVPYAEGSCLVGFGRTRVLCSASVETGVPGWKKGSGEGWVTAEYAMLPRATRTRVSRERSQVGGRT
ncbi:MAG: hypothetical protein EBV77_10870, partial [Gemmatimonadaceae bacterium]|nr:hypothetical protein [Gemmatimonadaceae bacterium]